MATPYSAMKYLRTRMGELGYTSLEQVAVKAGINRGNLYRYFTLETAPSIHLVKPLSKALKIKPEKLLKELGAL